MIIFCYNVANIAILLKKRNIFLRGYGSGIYCKIGVNQCISRVILQGNYK